MRVKKKDLRKRLAQLPINYPAPTIAVPFVYEKEANRVENLCRRLADNEVEVRDACLQEIPRFILDICSRTDFVEIAKQKDLPQGFSYEALSQFVSSSSSNNNNNKSKKQEEQEQQQQQQMFPEAVKELALIFDKLNLGIFYSLWHSDKPIVQHECAQRVSLLCHCPPSKILKILFWRSMWKALAVKWSIIDHHRIDKYMAYVRKLCFQNLRSIVESTMMETKPLRWTSSTTMSGGGEKTTTPQQIADDAMKLIGNQHQLQLFQENREGFKQKFARHLEVKKKRREAQEAAMAAKKNKKKKKSKKEETTTTEETTGEEKKTAAEAENSVKSKKESSKANAAAAASSSSQKPATATSLFAFIELLRIEIFQCTTSVGLAMHVIDVILDEIRRCLALHAFPSIMIALLFSIPFRAMSSGDVLQIERRVQLMIVQPIAGGIFERCFDSNNNNTNKNENDENENESESDEEENEEAISKAITLAQSCSLVLKQYAMDPRTKFVMRPVFEECARSVDGYVLLRSKPKEYVPVTAKDKRKMLTDTIYKKMFAKNDSSSGGGGTSSASSTATTKKPDKKKKSAAVAAIKKKKKASSNVKTSEAEQKQKFSAAMKQATDGKEAKMQRKKLLRQQRVQEEKATKLAAGLVEKKEKKAVHHRRRKKMAKKKG